MSDKVIIVTAASKGIGKAIAETLSERGYRLSLMSRSTEIHNSKFKENNLTIQGDVGKATDLENLVEETLRAFGRIDGVINNTGHVAKGDLLGLTDDEWAEGFELSFLNVVRMARLVTPELVKMGGGAIVNISSFAAKEPSLNFPVSSVVRTSVGAFAKLYASEYGSKNVRMNNILPGFVDSYEVNEEILKTIPMSRPAKTQEIANLAAFLMSDGSGYINGQSIIIDGGLTKSI